MRTIILLALLLPLSCVSQSQVPRALRPSDIDPYAIYIFQRCTSWYTTSWGACGRIAYYIIKDTGEEVRIPIACEDCDRWQLGLEMNFEAPEWRPDFQ